MTPGVGSVFQWRGMGWVGIVLVVVAKEANYLTLLDSSNGRDVIVGGNEIGNADWILYMDPV